MRQPARVALLAALLLPVVLLPAVPAPAGPQENPAVCVRIAHQLVHYDTMKQRAAAMGNTMWAGRFDAHIDKLEDDHAANCPESAKANKTAQALRDMLVLAGQSALTFFTMGAF